MYFEWHESKNKSNKRKHGISFERATLVFQDPDILSISDHRFMEERWQSLGMVEEEIIFVAHTIKVNEHEEEVIRIISAREATQSESRRYCFNSQNAQRIFSA